MDSKVLKFFLLLSLGISSALYAENVVFDEDFEGDPYVLDSPVPFNYGVIRHGRWVELAKIFRPGIVVEKDGRRSLDLTFNDGAYAKVRAIGSFGTDNQGSGDISDALDVRITFQISKLLDETFYIQLLGKDGKSRATIGMEQWGGLYVSFGGKREPLGADIQPGVWYVLQLLMPANPVTRSIFVANLYKADGKSLLDSRRGRVSRSVEEGGSFYTGFDIQHQVPDASLFIDSIKATVLSDGLPQE